MRAFAFVIVLSITSSISSAQYVLRSPYLADPDLAIPYVDSCAAFWIHAYDSTYGGFYTNIDRYGNVISSWGLNKNLVTTSRDAYGFVRAYMLTGNARYLTLARHALDFMEHHAWDTLHGGWYSTIDRFGNYASPGENKTAFDQHYALVGLAASCEATQDSTDWRYLMQGVSTNDEHLWDSSSQSFGYFDYASAAWQSPTGKSFNATVDAITTHELALYLLTGDDRYKTRLLQLADNMENRLVASMTQQKIGFVESYGADWSWNNNPANNNTRTIMGHVLKTAWCFGRIYQLFPDSAYLSAAARLVDTVWNLGYDHVFGGPYKDYDRVSGVMFMYGQADTAKAWWQMEQAVTGGLMLYEITGRELYLQMADESLDFFMNYFVDHQYSEVYSDRTRTGGQIWGTEKGNSGKAGYHSTELGYYVYIYGNLFLHRRSVTLHYFFAPADSDRTIRMNPVAWASDKYVMKQVLLDSATFSDFDASRRLLHLPPGTGGHFIVTYEPTGSESVTESNSRPRSFRLEQNYPNPFNPSTVIRYQLPAAGRVTLGIYDVIGRLITTLVDERQQAGRHEARWNAAGLPSGMYFYRLTSETGSSVGKALLLR